MKTLGKSVYEEIALFCGLAKFQFAIISWLLFSGLAQANTFYVWTESVASTPPYTNWDTAARTIQEAVDVAQPGDTVVVTNGVYDTGGRTAYGLITNRVVIDKAVTVQSVNGPAYTLIVGAPGPHGTNGAGAVRCCYVGTNAVLSGFTLTNGYTLVTGNTFNQDFYGGGALATPRSVLSNCVVIGNRSVSFGGGVCYGILNDCRLTNNTSLEYGGGAYYSAMNNCWVTGNRATNGGGGTRECFMTNCMVSGNLAMVQGGGSLGSLLQNCTVYSNISLMHGGGAFSGTMNNCMIRGNRALRSGGGSVAGWLNNCIITENYAQYGGGSASGDLRNCIITGNAAMTFAGGAYEGMLYNCIVYYNSAPYQPNYNGSTLFNSCSTPRPSLTGNIGDEPKLASISHLSADSPCRNRGNSLYASGKDIDGEVWQSPPCIGADQYMVGSVTGALAMSITVNYTTVSTGFELAFKAENQGAISQSIWNFGDGTSVTNQAYTDHVWAVPGLYEVRLTGYNESNPGGVSASVLVQVVSQPVHYVAAQNEGARYPFTNWATAAPTIQEAIDAASASGALILVTNGVYDTGGKAVYGLITNRVAVDKPIIVQSVNGPADTWIVGAGAGNLDTNGDGAIRCVYLGINGALSGFTLTNGHTRGVGDLNYEKSGGGIWCEFNATVSNCWIIGNSAAYYGGGTCAGYLRNCVVSRNKANGGSGAYYADLHNCFLTGNTASQGTVYSGTLNNCTVVSNSAGSVGGMLGGIMNNCIVYYNTSSGSFANYSGGTINNTCTLPLPSGTGNITNPPLFVDLANGNFRLTPGSPGIDAGDDTQAELGALDLDGRPRILGAHVDMGAYEAAPLQVQVPLANSSGLGTFGMRLHWTEPHRQYRLQYKTNLADTVWQSTESWAPGNGSNLNLTDANATNQHRFYRLESTNR